MMSLKPRDQRKSSADEVIRRLRRQFNAVSGGTAYLQAAQDINMGGRTTRDPVPVHACRTRISTN